jgi:hypothetical protein
LNIDKVIEIIKLFKPSFYNKITWAIVISGLALLGTSLLERILNAILEKEYNLTITDDKDSIFGFSLVVIALIYNIITVYFDKFLIQKQDNLIILEQKEVDKELYLKLIEDFPSDGNVIFFLRDYDLHDSFDYNSYVSPLIKIYNKWKNPEYDFLEKELNLAKNSIFDKIEKFIYDINMNSYPCNGCQRIIPPELGDWDLPKELTDKIKEMNILATEIYKEHQEFIKLCKSKLYV